MTGSGTSWTNLGVLGRMYGWGVRRSDHFDVLFLTKGERRLTIWFGTAGQIVEVTYRAQDGSRDWSMGARDRDKWGSVVAEVKRG